MKFGKQTYLTALATFAAGLLVGSLVVGAAAAANRTRTTGRTVMHHYTVDAGAFAPDELGDTSEDYAIRLAPATLSNQDSGRCFVAPAILPNGATIRSVTFFYTRGATSPFTGGLIRNNLAPNRAVLLAYFEGKGNGTSPVYTKHTLRVTHHQLVNTAKYSYTWAVCPYGDATFTAAMVNFTG